MKATRSSIACHKPWSSVAVSPAVARGTRSLLGLAAGRVGLDRSACRWAGILRTVARTSIKSQCSWRSEQLATTLLELTQKGPSVDRSRGRTSAAIRDAVAEMLGREPDAMSEARN